MPATTPNRPVLHSDPHILVLDDRPGEFELLQRELQGACFRCTATRVTSGDATFVELCQHPPDVIVSEETLTWADSLVLFHLIRDRCPDTPFLLITDGATSARRRSDEWQCCVDDCVPRQCLGELIPTLHRALHLAEERLRYREIERERDRLKKELATLRSSRHLAPATIHICRSCHRAKDAPENWLCVDVPFMRRNGIKSEWGLCPECADIYYDAQFALPPSTRADRSGRSV